MTEYQPQFASTGSTKPSKEDAPDYTITLDFDNSGNVTLDLGGLGLVTGDDEVNVYSAEGVPPTSRQSGLANRRAAYINPTGRLGRCPGGADGLSQPYWVQVQITRGGFTTTYAGNLTPTNFPATGVNLPLFRLT